MLQSMLQVMPLFLNFIFKFISKLPADLLFYHCLLFLHLSFIYSKVFFLINYFLYFKFHLNKKKIYLKNVCSLIFRYWNLHILQLYSKFSVNLFMSISIVTVNELDILVDQYQC